MNHYPSTNADPLPMQIKFCFIAIALVFDLTLDVMVLLRILLVDHTNRVHGRYKTTCSALGPPLVGSLAIRKQDGLNRIKHQRAHLNQIFSSQSLL